MRKRLIFAFAIYTIVLPTLAACDYPFSPVIRTATDTPTLYATITSTDHSQLTSIALPPTKESLPQTPPSIETVESLGPMAVSGTIQHPRSSRVQKGQRYKYVLYTHCGIDNDLDFDGTFWVQRGDAGIQFYSTAEPLPFISITEEGTLILLDDVHARFEFDKGFIDFTRHVGPKIVIGCE